MADENPSDITFLTVQLLSAYVSRNDVPSESLADLIKSTRAALEHKPDATPADAEPVKFEPAVSVRKSIASDDHIISLIDGKPYKTLKRHLASHGLTPDQYRERYKLPKTYPLVAKTYSEARRNVATKLGLGRKAAATALTTNSESTNKTAEKIETAKETPARKPRKTTAAPIVSAPTIKSSQANTEVPAKAAPSKAASAKPEAKKPASPKKATATPAAADKVEAATTKAGPEKTAARAKAKDKGATPPKAADATPAAKPAAAQATTATATTGSRKKLSIASSAQGADGKEKAAEPVKAKKPAKPKTLKDALEAASSHLSIDKEPAAETVAG